MRMLAGDALAGRRSGTRDEWIAARYAASQLLQWGVGPAPGHDDLLQVIEAGDDGRPSGDGSDGDPGEDSVASRTWNVIGLLPGREGPRAAEVILLSAHLDHLGTREQGDDPIFNGADDNASGVTAVLEIARRLAAGPRRARTVMFALFGGEERGGIGSRAFVGEPPVELDRIVFNVNIEMIGRPDPSIGAGMLWMTGYERSTLGSTFAGRDLPIVADPYPDQQFFFRSDNIRLARLGVVAHTVSSFGMHRDYHTPDDEIERIDFAHLGGAIDTLSEAVGWLAESEVVPEWHEGGQP